MPTGRSDCEHQRCDVSCDRAERHAHANLLRLLIDDKREDAEHLLQLQSKQLARAPHGIHAKQKQVADREDHRHEPEAECHCRDDREGGSGARRKVRSA